jgi:hypothetical protein
LTTFQPFQSTLYISFFVQKYDCITLRKQ